MRLTGGLIAAVHVHASSGVRPNVRKNSREWIVKMWSGTHPVMSIQWFVHGLLIGVRADVSAGTIRSMPELSPTKEPDMAAHGGPPDTRAFCLGPHDAGLGSVRPDQVVALGPHDAGLGSVRPDQVVALPRPERLRSWLRRHRLGHSLVRIRCEEGS
jgi:hypothetical protein